MKNSKELEPEINLFHPLLVHYSPEAAVLYAYLKDVIRRNEKVDKAAAMKKPQLCVTRWQIELRTGLSNGRQIDAEKDLVGAGLAHGYSSTDGKVEYFLYPENEERLRRFVNSKRFEWSNS